MVSAISVFAFPQNSALRLARIPENRAEPQENGGYAGSAFSNFPDFWNPGSTRGEPVCAVRRARFVRKAAWHGKPSGSLQSGPLESCETSGKPQAEAFDV